MTRNKKRVRRSLKKGARSFRVGGYTYRRYGKFSVSDNEGQPLDL